MPILFSALPVSMQTFWRFLIVTPFVLIGASPLLLVAMMFEPVVLFLSLAGMIYLFAGLRCALSTRGFFNPLHYGRFFLICAGYGLIVTLFQMGAPVLGEMVRFALAQAEIDISLAALLGQYIENQKHQRNEIGKSRDRTPDPKRHEGHKDHQAHPHQKDFELARCIKIDIAPRH